MRNVVRLNSGRRIFGGAAPFAFIPQAAQRFGEHSQTAYTWKKSSGIWRKTSGWLSNYLCVFGLSGCDICHRQSARVQMGCFWWHLQNADNQPFEFRWHDSGPENRLERAQTAMKKGHSYRATNQRKWRNIEIGVNWLIMNRKRNDLHGSALFKKGNNMKI